MLIGMMYGRVFAALWAPLCCGMTSDNELVCEVSHFATGVLITVIPLLLIAWSHIPEPL